MTIGEFASRCGLSPKALRKYAEAGVLPPAVIDPTSGYRYFNLCEVHASRPSVPIDFIAPCLRVVLWKQCPPAHSEP